MWVITTITLTSEQSQRLEILPIREGEILSFPCDRLIFCLLHLWHGQNTQRSRVKDKKKHYIHSVNRRTKTCEVHMWSRKTIMAVKCSVYNTGIVDMPKTCEVHVWKRKIIPSLSAARIMLKSDILNASGNGVIRPTYVKNMFSSKPI